jgi:hypothetical protein
MVVHQHTGDPAGSATTLHGVTLAPHPVSVHMSRFDLIFAFRESKDELTLGVEYSTDLSAARSFIPCSAN